MTPPRPLEVPEVLEVQLVPSDEVKIFPEVPTATNDGVASLVNPVPVSYWLFKVFLAPESLTPVVTLILYVVEKDKLEESVTVKVLLSLEAIGEEDICTQVLKLSEDT